MIVALLAEGVDRNGLLGGAFIAVVVSPSSRRAWIEIFRALYSVAASRSPSSRRAWIEIVLSQVVQALRLVALRTEGVDGGRG